MGVIVTEGRTDNRMAGNRVAAEQMAVGPMAGRATEDRAKAIRHRLGAVLCASALAMAVWEGAHAQEAGAQNSGDSTGEGGATTPIVLDRVLVEGEQGVVTEGTGSYTTDRATVGYDQPTDLKDIPQAVTVITRQRLDDAIANTIEEAGYLIPNVSTAIGDPFIGSLYARGHEVFTYNVDGAPRPFLSLYGTAPDLSFFDRVEVLSGPSGVFQGSGEPVGTINLVRKRPGKTFSSSVGGFVQSFGGYRGDLDISAPLNEDGSVRTRLMAYGMHEDSFVDITDNEKFGGYGTIEYDITDATTLSFGAIKEQQDVTRFNGLPTFTDGTLLSVDRSTYIGAPWNKFETDPLEVFGEVEHKFGFGGVLKTTARYYGRESINKSALASTGVDPVTGDFDMFTFARNYEEDSGYLETNLTAPLELFGRSGMVSAGGDFRYMRQATRQNFDFSLGTQNINTFDPNSLAEPDITFPGVGPGFRLNTETKTWEAGVYGQGRLEIIDRLNLTLGARLSIYDSDTNDTGRNLETSSINETRFLPYIGLGYDITDEITLYTSFSEIFQPQTEQTAAGAQLDPITGTQYEIGAKGSFLNDALQSQLAVFYLEDKNRAEEDPNNVGAFTAAGEAETYGFEAMVTGSPYPGVELALGYTYVDTTLNDDPTPPHSFTAWGKYTFQEGDMAGLSLGLGARAVSSFKNDDGGIEINGPGYAVFDAMIGYKVSETIEMQLVARNLLDKTYIDRVNEVARGNFYGEPFNATFRVKAIF